MRHSPLSQIWERDGVRVLGGRGKPYHLIFCQVIALRWQPVDNQLSIINYQLSIINYQLSKIAPSK